MIEMLRELQEGFQRVETLAGQQQALLAASPPSDACFLRVHFECGLNGKLVSETFSRSAAEKGFEAEVMRGWCREASEVLAGVTGSVWKGIEAGKPLDDRLRSLEDRVRDAEDELMKAQTELEKAEGALQEAGAEHASGEAAKGGWQTTEELRATLREVFQKMDLNQDGSVDAEERAKGRGFLNELRMELGLQAEVVFQGETTFEEFEARLVREWEIARKEQALAGVSVARAVAELLPGGSPETPLEHLKGMSGAELGRFCRRSVAAGVEALLSAQQETLRKVGRQGDRGDGAEESNAKYAQGEEVLGQARTALKP